jgi:hypothetical protein
MFKYIVTWVLTTYFSVPCIVPEPKPDEYGRVGQSRVMLAMACLSSASDTLTKTFYNRDSAIVFIEKGKGGGSVYPFDFLGKQELSDFKLDSIKIKK